jgi:glutathione S-transferase
VLEECALPYKAIALDIGIGAPFQSDFFAISADNRIPVLFDIDGPDGQSISMFESAAILPSPADRTGRLQQGSPRAKDEVPQRGMDLLAGLSRPLISGKAREVVLGTEQCNARGALPPRIDGHAARSSTG